MYVNSYTDSRTAERIYDKEFTEFSYTTVPLMNSKCTKVRRYDQCDYVITNATGGLSVFAIVCMHGWSIAPGYPTVDDSVSVPR